MSGQANMDIDVAENQVVFTRVFAAPRGLVFEDRVAAMETGMAQGMAETLDRFEEHVAGLGNG
jgi:hypothetical protein